MTDEERKELFELYKLSIEEEHYFLDGHQNRIAFFISILSALFGATVVGFYQSDKWYHFLILAVSSLAVVFICRIATQGISRLYRRFLEAITVRSKLEKELGLMTERLAKNKDFWLDYEPIINKRHVDTNIIEGKNHADSKAWVEAKMEVDESYHVIIKSMFYHAELFGFGLCIALLLLMSFKLKCLI